MKPDWKDAPEWANWLAMDDDCVWHWHEYEPRSSLGGWFNDGDMKIASAPPPHWTATKEPRE